MGLGDGNIDDVERSAGECREFVEECAEQQEARHRRRADAAEYNVQHAARGSPAEPKPMEVSVAYVSCYGHCSVLLRTTRYRAPSCGRWPRSHAPAGQCRGSVPVISLRCRAAGCELDGGCASHAAPARLSPVAFGDGLGHVARGVELVARVTHVLRLPPPPYRTMPWDTVPWDTVLSGNTVLSGDTCWLISAMPPALSAIGP